MRNIVRKVISRLKLWFWAFLTVFTSILGTEWFLAFHLSCLLKITLTLTLLTRQKNWLKQCLIASRWMVMRESWVGQKIISHCHIIEKGGKLWDFITSVSRQFFAPSCHCLDSINLPEWSSARRRMQNKQNKFQLLLGNYQPLIHRLVLLSSLHRDTHRAQQSKHKQRNINKSSIQFKAQSAESVGKRVSWVVQRKTFSM